MRYRLQKEIEKLKKDILTLGALVEERMQDAVTAVNTRDAALGRKIIEGDREIDELEVDLEEECLKLLALHQPVAIDLRFIIATLKINNDLERIGDLAVNICERCIYLSSLPEMKIGFDFPKMAGLVKEMLKKSLDSLVTMDGGLARSVCGMDDAVDAMNKEMIQLAEKEICRLEEQHSISYVLHLLSISRHLERIADLATNIAEDVVYMTEGRIIRHTPEQYLQ